MCGTPPFSRHSPRLGLPRRRASRPRAPSPRGLSLVSPHQIVELLPCVRPHCRSAAHGCCSCIFRWRFCSFDRNSSGREDFLPGAHMVFWPFFLSCHHSYRWGLVPALRTTAPGGRFFLLCFFFLSVSQLDRTERNRWGEGVGGERQGCPQTHITASEACPLQVGHGLAWRPCSVSVRD